MMHSNGTRHPAPAWGLFVAASSFSSLLLAPHSGQPALRFRATRNSEGDTDLHSIPATAKQTCREAGQVSLLFFFAARSRRLIRHPLAVRSESQPSSAGRDAEGAHQA
jgi:hypothetical protein